MLLIQENSSCNLGAIQAKKEVKQTRKRRKGVNETAEKVFKYCSCFLVLTLIFFTPGFMQFRHHIQAEGFYVFSTSQTYIIVLGFISIFLILRYGYYLLARPFMDRFVKQGYQGQQRQVKIDTFLKLSFDSVFYFCVTMYFIYHFRAQYWFPQLVGGCGSCNQMFNEYPNWPLNKREQLENYFLYQIGVHTFSLFELFVVRRRKERKFYQFTLHHVVVTVLILFSMMGNLTVPGGMILALHDGSDISLGCARLYFQLKLPKWIKNKYLQLFLGVQLLFFWVYLRLIVFPFCVLNQVYQHLPAQSDNWFMIKHHIAYLLILASVLVIMHVYWLIYLLNSFKAFLTKSDVVNLYDTPKNQ